MDEAILRHLFELYGIKAYSSAIMSIAISGPGNSSVATLPTMYDLMGKGQFINQTLQPDSHIVFASLGAGVNMNAVVYKIPDEEKQL
ncbi:hypothetical protein [Runella sp.]|uniref:hypothetical protein n=1 Tax=Runella sp. TaxID=1960881 RepID=UPI003D124F40